MTLVLGSKIISAEITAFITGTLCKYTMTLTEALKWQGKLKKNLDRDLTCLDGNKKS